MGQVRERSAALAVAAVLVFVGCGLSGCGGDDDGGGSDPQAVSQDAEAKATARNAQVALEVYATEKNGSYAEATTEKLARIEPTLSGADLTVTTEPQGYDLTVESESGNSFTVTRNEAGTVSRSCDTQGDGGCPEGGEW